MTDKIKVLPEHIANCIAAGEVINRPANAVKELMENAVDAGATCIKVVIRQSGKELIKVIDDGCGMSPTDAANSFLRHATSKISCAEDLFQLHTKGFRGEALASIAAVAQVEMTTRRKEDSLGTRIQIEGSQVVESIPATAAVGTTVAVKNLFYNIPARRNFLKSDAVEFARISDEFTRVALAHSEIAFELYRGDDVVYKLQASSLRRRIVGLFRSNTDNKLVPIEEKTPDVTIRGFVYKPEYARVKNADQFIFVNNRYVKSSYLSSAVSSAFTGLIPERHYPGYFLYIDVDPSTIDINISPTKTDISFDDERTIYSFLRATIRHALGKYSVLPSLDFSQDPEIVNVLDHPKENVEMPSITFDPTYNPFEDEEKTRGEVKINSTSAASTSSSSGYSGRAASFAGFKNSDAWEVIINDYKEETEKEDASQARLFDTHTEQRVSDENVISRERYTLVNGRYILSHIKTGLMLIDPIRAHWRILYEKLMHDLTSRGSLSQQILFTVTLDLNATQRIIFDQMEGELSLLGFQFEHHEGGEITVIGVPVGVKEGEVAVFIDQVIDDYKNDAPSSIYERQEKIARSLSYSMCIKRTNGLSYGEMESIVTELFECASPSIAPNGKSTFIRIDIDELEKKFN